MHLSYSVFACFEPPPPFNVVQIILCIVRDTTITGEQHWMGGRGEIKEQSQFFPLLFLDVQMFNENLLCVATILLWIVV